MMNSMKKLRYITTLGAVFVLPIYAQKYDTPTAANNVESFKKQGEYVGTATDGTKLGAWLVARSGSRYAVTFLPGGLLTLPNDPNGGWDEKTRYLSAGDQAITALSSPQGYTASVTGSGEAAVMTVTGPGSKTYTLKRVERKSPTLGLQPKAEWNAETWFKEKDAASLSNWRTDGSAPKLTEEGYLNYGILSTKTHGACYLHIEVRSPYCPNTDILTQDRGNSGIYLRSIYEMQVYDSFGGGLEKNLAGAIYGVSAASVNAALPPMKFATYDAWFTPKQGSTWPRITFYLNGVRVQNNTEITSDNTEGGKGTNPLVDGSLFLQNHGSNVTYNNIWIVKGTNLPTWQQVLEASGSVSIGKTESNKLRLTRNNSQITILNMIDGTPAPKQEMGKYYNILGRIKW
ncbi:MAG: DUF1080 domain-containing protein [Fibrobacteria bacterium]